MYKTRLSRWGIYKYCRRTEKNSAAAKIGSTNTAAPPERQGLHERAKVAYSGVGPVVARRSQAGGPTAAALRHLLRAPDDLRLPEECIHIVDGFARGATERRLWALDEAGLLAPGTELSTWNNLTDVTLTLLLPQRPDFAFRVLRKCFDQYGDLMRREGGDGPGNAPWLFLSTYAFVLRTAATWPDLARCFLRYCRDLARIIHPAGHPYPRLLDAMCRMGPARMEACAADLLDSCILAIERQFGPDSYCMAHALVYITNLCVAGRTLMPDVAGSKLRGLLERLEARAVNSDSVHYNDGGSNDAEAIMRDFVPGLRLSLMRASYRAGDFKTARQVAQGVPENRPEWAYGPKIMQFTYEERPDVRELLRVGHLWGSVIKKEGIASPWMTGPMIEFRAYFERFADRDADIARRDLEAGMEILCQLVCDDLTC